MMKKFILLFAVLITLAGCRSYYFKSVDGVSNSLGIYLPDESNLKIQVLEYLSGEKVVVRDASKIKYSFSTTSTNSYLGLIHVNEQRKSEIEISPMTNTVDEVTK